MKKILLLIIVNCIILVGCGKKEVEEPTPNFNVENTASNITEEVIESHNNYYTDLINNKNEKELQQKEKAEQDFELANIILSECTKKLKNCTLTLTAISNYDCSDIEINSFDSNEIPNHGKYVVERYTKYNNGDNQTTIKHNKYLYRDNIEVSNEDYIVLGQLILEDGWSDRLGCLLLQDSDYYDVFDINEDKLDRNEIYSYLGKDIRSTLSDFLALNNISITEENDLYVIKGTSKLALSVINSSSLNTLFNSRKVIPEKIKKNEITPIKTKGILAQDYCNITLYIDKAKENLLRIVIDYKNDKNNEVSHMECEITDIGTTEIIPFNNKNLTKEYIATLKEN